MYYVTSGYLGGFLRLQFPHDLALLCNTLIKVRRRGRVGCRWGSRGGGGGRGHPWFVLLTGQLFKLCLQSEELLHCTINLVLVPSTNQLVVAGS